MYQSELPYMAMAFLQYEEAASKYHIRTHTEENISKKASLSTIIYEQSQNIHENGRHC